MVHNKAKTRAIFFAFGAALLFGMQAPFSKFLVNELDTLFLAALLYLGAGIGMAFVMFFEQRINRTSRERPLDSKDIPYVTLMVILDIIAPILLLFGLRLSSAGTASLLGNFEIVATSVLAMFFFREKVGRRLWLAIALITIASLLLSIGSVSDIRWSPGALLILMACVAWGLENNCTRILSGKDPLQIVVIKGLGSGFGSLILAVLWGSVSGKWVFIAGALGLGFVAYGLSIFLYVKAQRELGAARTSAFYAAAPFIGVALSWLLLREKISSTFLLALTIMIVGSVIMLSDRLHQRAVPDKYAKHGHAPE